MTLFSNFLRTRSIAFLVLVLVLSILSFSLLSFAQSKHSPPSVVTPPETEKPDMTLIHKVQMVDVKSKEGVTFPDSETVDGHTLYRNGVALREATVLGISLKVYVGALYVEKKSSDGLEILATTTPKRVVQHFKHYVRSGEIFDAWKKGISANCGDKASCEKLSQAEKQLKDILKSVKSDQVYVYDFYPDKVVITLEKENLGTINSGDLSHALLATLIDKSEFPHMKAGYLGQE